MILSSIHYSTTIKSICLTLNLIYYIVVVVAGDPMYDPGLAADQQVFKASYQFTDKMYNMSQLTAGKKEIRTSFSLNISEISYITTTATATIPTGHTLVDGTSVTISGVTGDDAAVYNGTFNVTNVTATSFDYTLPSQPSALANNTEIKAAFTISSGVDHTVATGLHFKYASGVEPSGTTDEKKQMIDTITLQTKNTSSGIDHSKFDIEPLKTALKTIGGGNVVKSEMTLSQSVQELTFSDSSKFSVDNSVKKVSTDMSTLEFGPSTNKHRLAIEGGKLFIQKYDGTSWVGADIVVDVTSAFTATIAIDATNTVAGKVDVTATLGGSGHDSWFLKLDDGSEVEVTGATTFQLDSTYIGIHQVVAYAADSDDKRISEYAVFSITTTM